MGKISVGQALARKNPTKSYKEVCGFARDTKMLVRTLLYDYADDIKRLGVREFAN